MPGSGFSQQTRVWEEKCDLMSNNIEMLSSPKCFRKRCRRPSFAMNCKQKTTNPNPGLGSRVTVTSSLPSTACGAVVACHHGSISSTSETLRPFSPKPKNRNPKLQNQTPDFRPSEPIGTFFHTDLRDSKDHKT